MDIIDLSHTFDEKTKPFPGDPCPKFFQVSKIEDNNYNEVRVESGLHIGTHMDAPIHMVENGKFISEIPIDKFEGRGVLIDARGKEKVDANLLSSVEIKEGDIVLVMTGFEEKYGSDEYFNSFPELTECFANALVDKKVNIVAMDTPSPDSEPYPIHKILLANNVLIIENAANLKKLVNIKNFVVLAYPPKFSCDAAPIRVIAKV